MRIAVSTMLILAMAGAANATLTIVAPDVLGAGEVAELGIAVEGELALLSGALVTCGSDVLSVDSSQVTIVDMGLGEFAFDLAGDPDVEAYLADLGIIDVVSAVYYEVIDISGTPRAIPDGMLLDNAFVTGLAMGTGSVHIVDMSAGEIIASADIQRCRIIPEPATAVLLGFGALFVRRRRG